jgi:hypothetical protein
MEVDDGGRVLADRPMRTLDLHVPARAASA